MSDRKIVKYMVVSRTYKGDLERAINDVIGMGWQPQGGVSFRMSGMSEEWAQAVVKYEVPQSSSRGPG